MAYAARSDLLARAGALQAAWTATSEPSLTDLDGFLTEISAQIDALLAGHGFTTPAAGTAATALVGVNADGALLLALEATYPEAAGPASAASIVEEVQARYDTAMQALEDGTDPVIRLLEAGDVSHRASSFWDNEPLYGIFPSDPDILTPFSADANPSTRPTITRGTSL